MPLTIRSRIGFGGGIRIRAPLTIRSKIGLNRGIRVLLIIKSKISLSRDIA